MPKQSITRNSFKSCKKELIMDYIKGKTPEYLSKEPGMTDISITSISKRSVMSNKNTEVK